VADHDDRYLDCCAAYALGILDGDELGDFESHLKSECQVCRSEMIALSRAASLLPLVLPQLSVSPDLKERVLFNAGFAQVMSAFGNAAPETTPDETVSPAGEPVPERRVRRRSIPLLTYGAAFAVIALLIGFSIYVKSLFRTIDRQVEYIATQQGQITKLIDEVERREAIQKVLESRRIQIVRMDGLGVNPAGHGSIIWDPDRKTAVLHVSNLPAVPENKDYQLWIMRGQMPISAGIFTVVNGREGGSSFLVGPLEVVERKDIDAFAVTLEPKGGVPQPTGETYLLGKPLAQ